MNQQFTLFAEQEELREEDQDAILDGMKEYAEFIYRQGPPVGQQKWGMGRSRMRSLIYGLKHGDPEACMIFEPAMPDRDVDGYSPTYRRFLADVTGFHDVETYSPKDWKKVGRVLLPLWEQTTEDYF